MPAFPGFSDGKTRLTPIPAAFFSELLPQINDLFELKILLYIFWFINQQQGHNRYLLMQNFLDDEVLMRSLGEDKDQAKNNLTQALTKLVARGVVMEQTVIKSGAPLGYYFLNTPRGRAAQKALQTGAWQPEAGSHLEIELAKERPTIYRLYEENIGPLTPMIAEVLGDAAQTYPERWIEEAIQIAVENNVRRWRYVEAILASWQEKGIHGTNRKSPEKDRDYYLKGEFAKYIQ